MRVRMLLIIFIFSFCGCAGLFHSPGQETLKTYSRIYIADYNTAWQAAIDAVKQFDRTIQNRQAGIIQTGWTDSTSDKLFSDPFGGAETYIKSRYRINISVAPGFYNGKQSVKIAVQKELMMQRDVLEGWKPVLSDSVHETTVLYRIGRIVRNKLALKKIEDQKIQEILDEGV